MDKKTLYLFRVKSLILKCRERGKFERAIKIKEAYERKNSQVVLVQVGSSGMQTL